MPADDPKAWLTKWLTKGKEEPEEKTRVMSKEQKEFYYAYAFLGSEDGLGIKFFEDLAFMDMRLMMAFQGRRSDDIVEALKRFEESESKDVGFQPLRKALSDMERKKEG